MNALRLSAMTSEQRQRRVRRFRKFKPRSPHHPAELRKSHLAGDLIATEWLHRLEVSL
jgi:hypothetical protein